MYTDIADELLDDILDKLYVQGNKVYNQKDINYIELEKFINKFMSSYDNKILHKYSNEDIQNQIKNISKLNKVCGRDITFGIYITKHIRH